MLFRSNILSPADLPTGSGKAICNFDGFPTDIVYPIDKIRDEQAVNWNNNQRLGGGINVCPNPAIEKICVVGLVGKISNIVILDLFGRKVLEKVGESDSVTIQLENLPAGTYQIMIRDGQTNYRSKLIIL